MLPDLFVKVIKKKKGLKRWTTRCMRGSWFSSTILKVRGKFSLMCLVHDVKKIAKRVVKGAVSLPERHDKLLEEINLVRGKNY